jgi:hypothetical protein
MTACILKPALYILQCMNAEEGNNGHSTKEASDAKQRSQNQRTSNYFLA